MTKKRFTALRRLLALALALALLGVPVLAADGEPVTRFQVTLHHAWYREDVEDVDAAESFIVEADTPITDQESMQRAVQEVLDSLRNGNYYDKYIRNYLDRHPGYVLMEKKAARTYQPGEDVDIYAVYEYDGSPVVDTFTVEFTAAFRYRLDGVEDEGAKFGPLPLHAPFPIISGETMRLLVQYLAASIRDGDEDLVELVRQYPDYTLKDVTPDRTDYDVDDEVTIWLDYEASGETVDNPSQSVLVYYLYCDQSGQMTGLDMYETTKGQVSGIHSKYPPDADAFYVKTVVLSNDGNYVPVLPAF
ncbi:MAG: hypothetical protein IJT94_07215 [Oscillibacter sp.]|nr:hypothetical protein [Oscillibacter sp.]